MGMRNKISLFWVVSVSVMVFAMCVLSLQIIELNQKKDEQLTKIAIALPQLEAIQRKAPEAPSPTTETLDQEDEVVKQIPQVVMSQRLRTPRTIRQYDRQFFSVPSDGNCGYWSILRGLNPEDELLKPEDIASLKKKAAQVAQETFPAPNAQTIKEILKPDSQLDSAFLPYISSAIKRDIIVSNSMGLGYDLFTEDGETFHYNTLDEIEAEAFSQQTIWLHNFNNEHWTVALPSIEEKPKKVPSEEEANKEVYFLLK